MGSSSEAARALLEQQREGVLATLSVRHAGWPFASLAPFALDVHGEPLLLLSSLAEHTRNLRADARASLLVQDGQGQAGARLTLLGTVEPVSPDDVDARARYLKQHPDAREYLAMLDFFVYVLHVDSVRFIAGFGDMRWIDGADFLRTV